MTWLFYLLNNRFCKVHVNLWQEICWEMRITHSCVFRLSFAVFLLNFKVTRLFPHAHGERYAFLAVTRSVGALTRLISVAVVLFSVSLQMAVGTDPLKNAFTENWKPHDQEREPLSLWSGSYFWSSCLLKPSKPHYFTLLWHICGLCCCCVTNSVSAQTAQSTTAN